MAGNAEQTTIPRLFTKKSDACSASNDVADVGGVG